MILTNGFYVVLFMSVISAMSWLMLLLVQSIGHIKLPHPLFVVLMTLFIVPIKFPYLKWVDPDPNHTFIPEFELVAKVWITGTIILLLVMLFKAAILKFSMRKFTHCTDQKVLVLLDACANKTGLRRIPAVFYGTFSEPACVVSCLYPSIVLSERTLKELNEDELYMVLLHECTHVKLLHLPLKRIFDLFCCIHWMNPFAWIARHEFSLSCEMDCDVHVIRKLSAGNESGYVRMLIRLMELSLRKPFVSQDTVGILAFMDMKQRLGSLLLPKSKARQAAAAITCALVICVTVWGSLSLSKGTFYPYPAYQSNTEWSENTNVGH